MAHLLVAMHEVHLRDTYSAIASPMCCSRPIVFAKMVKHCTDVQNIMVLIECLTSSEMVFSVLQGYCTQDVQFGARYDM